MTDMPRENQNNNNSVSSSSSSDSAQSSSSSASHSSSAAFSSAPSSPVSSSPVSSSPVSRSQPNSQKSPISFSSPSSDHSDPTTASVETEDVKMLDKLLGIKEKFACDLCGKKVLYMKSHMKKMHGEGRPGCVVDCGQCDRTVLLSEMADHVLNYHFRLERSPSPESEEPEQFSVKDWVKTDKEKQSASQPNSSQEIKENFNEKFLTSSRNDPDRGKKCKTSPSKKICDNSGVGKIAHAGISKSGSLKRSYSESSKKSPDLNKTVPDSTNTNENKSQCNNLLESKEKLVFRSFLCDDSDDTDDSDIDIVEIVPPVSNLGISSHVDDGLCRTDIDTDCNKNRQPKLKPMSREGKIKFWVKSKEKTLSGGKVKSRRIVMRPVKTVGQAKISYTNKLVLDMNRRGELQFLIEGRKLEEKEQLNNTIVMAEGLCFKAVAR